MAAHPIWCPPGLALRPFQKDGVKFLTLDPTDPDFPTVLGDHTAMIAHGKYHKLLADDMGLGKTVMAVAAINAIDARSIVIVCPSSVKIHWAREIATWSIRKRNIFIFRSGKCAIPPGADVIIVNYELMIKPNVAKQITARSSHGPYDVAILDEAHYLKSTNAKRTDKILGKASFLHNTRYKWALTGTPILNRPIEMYPILYTFARGLIEPHVSYYEFGMRYCNGAWDSAFKGHSNLKELSDRIKPFMLRRKKEDVLSELPAMVETVIELDVEIPSDLDDAPIATVRRDLGVAKIPAAIEHLRELLSTVPKIVVFCHHREVVQSIAEGLIDFNPVKIYGGMSSDEKQASVDRFVTDPAVRVAIGNMVAGGTGIDGLQKSSSYVIFAELDWAPGVMDQARDRLRRIGQKETVFVQYLVVPDSLDSTISDFLDRKRYVISQVIKASEVNETMSLEDAVNRLAAAIEAQNGGAVATDKPAKPAPKKPNPAKETPADPAVTGATQAQAKTATGSLSQDDMRKLCGGFINKTPDKDTNRAIINDQIWPKYEATSLADLDPKYYAEAAEDLKKGPAAYQEAASGDEDMGV